MKTLLAVGCSFTSKNFKSKVHPEIDCSFPKWPEVLGNKLGYNVVNLGLSGNSNDRIFKTTQDYLVNNKVDINLFSEAAEQELHKQVTAVEKIVAPKFKSRHYAEALTDLAQLRSTIDTFFDDVMVMDENENVRSNRIALLANVNRLFSTVADISLLQS